MKDADGALTWRASWPPIQYCTHSLGPLLFITDDRCVSATGLSSGSNVAPDIGAIDLEVGLFRTANGVTIKILCGFSIERHPAFHWYIIYGANGVLELKYEPGTNRSDDSGRTSLLTALDVGEVSVIAGVDVHPPVEQHYLFKHKMLRK